jgi:hypothetical protein
MGEACAGGDGCAKAELQHVQMFRCLGVQAGRMAGEDAIRVPRGSQWGTGRCTGAKQWGVVSAVVSARRCRECRGFGAMDVDVDVDVDEGCLPTPQPLRPTRLLGPGISLPNTSRG